MCDVLGNQLNFHKVFINQLIVVNLEVNLGLRLQSMYRMVMGTWTFVLMYVCIYMVLLNRSVHIVVAIYKMIYKYDKGGFNPCCVHMLFLIHPRVRIYSYLI